MSDAAKAVLTQATFPANHRVRCDCQMDGSTVKVEDCRYLHVMDADNKAIARFSIEEFQAQENGDGSITILRRPAGQKTADKGLTLAKLNKIHSEFYRRGDA